MASIVIKVKFGETLRRLNVSVNESKLVFDMVMLKEKIRSLFSFGSDVEFTMTYVDEDGDTVTLSDDEDLHDVVRQSLNPLRITVSLKDSSSNGSNGSSTNLNSAQGQVSFQTLQSEAAELMNKLTTVYADQLLPSMASLLAQSITGGSPAVNSQPPAVVNPEAGGSILKKKEKEVQKVTNGVKFQEVTPPKCVDVNKPHFEYKSFQAPTSSTGKDKNTTDGVDKKKVSSLNDVSTKKHANQYAERMNQMRPVSQFPQVAHNNNTNVSGSYSGWARGMMNATSQCPFSGMPLTSYGGSWGNQLQSLNPNWKSYSPDNKGMGNIFHRGVRCDGCGAHPITGPRFKSKVKDDYDLCNACFTVMGNGTDYTRIDYPINTFRNHHPSSVKGFYDPSLFIPPSTLPHAMRASESKLSQSKLDSRFILDVNVLDGTIMAPFTAFTKIWRMKNNGSDIWPCGSRLQWIGGDRLSKSDSVDVKIPVDGLPVDKELDIAVDFTAPELAGRYVSYWRMVSPSGEKFGQRVWVLFQVDASMKNLGETSSINLNLPPVTSDLEAVNQDQDQDRPVDSNFSGNNISTDSENTSVDLPLPPNDGDTSSTMSTLSASPVVTSSSVFSPKEVGTALGSLPPAPKFIFPSVELDTDPVSVPPVSSVMPPVMMSGSASPSSVVVQPSGSGGRVVTDDEEQALVEELEDMGFKKVELNKEVLRMNNYDLEKSIDDLCGVLEWDPMLDELQEMGFADDEANRRLLKKNNGSIKRVVMDLINGEKA